MKKIAIKITEGKERAAVRLKVLSQSQYVEEALKRAEYYRDENGVVIAKVPGASGFFAQGDSFEEVGLTPDERYSEYDAKIALEDARFVYGTCSDKLKLGFSFFTYIY
ncbi:MAG: hypothetical protein IMF19_17080 [Proteobacteria bacterium]|nr:hypothetical protein [Pseudomonadota bacterium]